MRPCNRPLPEMHNYTSSAFVTIHCFTHVRTDSHRPLLVCSTHYTAYSAILIHNNEIIAKFIY